MSIMRFLLHLLEAYSEKAFLPVCFRAKIESKIHIGCEEGFIPLYTSATHV